MKSNKKGKDGELTDAEKVKLKTHEIDVLKDNLAFRRDFARKSKAAYDEIKDRLDTTHTNIEEMESIHRASTAYLTNQYKTMQADMQHKQHQLESELNQTRRKLEDNENQLKNLNEEKKIMLKEKNDLIDDLREKNRRIQDTYDSIIQSTFDKFVENLNLKKSSWEYQGEQLQKKNKDLLAELGLKIHDI